VDPDLPLIEALQAGGDSALTELIHRHREPLFHFVFRYLRDETAARDVVQETFVRVYFKAAKFTPKFSVKTWVYTIALNLCRDHARRLTKRRGDVSLDAPVATNASRVEVTDNALTPSVRAIQVERFAALQQAINDLPQKLKEALILFSIEERSQKEVAELLETTPKTVELRVYRARTRLREALGGNAL
jgi:RNA polymerase sigma factor (sigma-70 family)